MDEQFKILVNRYKKLLADIKADSAGYASTQLHFFRTRLDELNGIKTDCLFQNQITIGQNRFIAELAKEIHEIIKNRLQERILWIARGIDRTIESRKQKGTYKGEFDTATILANAFNDILGHVYGENFTGHPEKE